MFSNASEWSKLSGFGLFGLCLTLGACGGASSGTSESEPVGSIEAALEAPILQCQQDQVTCLGDAKDEAGVSACSTTFQTCLDAAAKKGQQAVSELTECRDKAAECVTKAAADSMETCRTEFESCVEGVLGTPSLPTAGRPSLPRLPLAGRPSPRLPTGGGLAFPGGIGPRAGAPSLPRVPNFPSAGAPSLPRLPVGGARSLPTGGRRSFPTTRTTSPLINCFVDLRECVVSGEDPSKCASTARTCVQGSGRPTSGGAGGAGGSQAAD